MGFRPMPDITSTAINVYGDLASQNNTISSLRAYRVGKKISSKTNSLINTFLLYSISHTV